MRKKFCVWAISGNEEKWVEQWCSSVMKAKPDIVVINLTQYDDNSEELFRKFIPEDKLILVKHEWKKSFSEARNHALEAIPDDVVFAFFLDLDEIITENSFENIEEILNNEKDEHYLYLITIYNSMDQKTSLTASLYYPRFFPMKNKAGEKLCPSFDGTVHNQLIYPDNVQLGTVRPDVSIMHFGYSLDKEDMEKKHKRSEELLRQQIKEDNDNFFAHLNLAQLLRAKGDNVGTEFEAREVLRIITPRLNKKGGDVKYNHANIMAREQLATSLLVQRRFEESIEQSKIVLSKKSDHLDSAMNLAHAFMEMKDFEQAEFWLKRFLFIRSRYNEKADGTNFILNHLNSSFLAIYHLGQISLEKRDFDSAKEYFFKSYLEEPNFRDTFIRYLHCLKILGDGKKINEETNKFLHEHPGKSAMIYTFFSDSEVENTNFEVAKFNSYQALHLAGPDDDKEILQKRYNALVHLFGPVSSTFFDTSGKTSEMLEKVT